MKTRCHFPGIYLVAVAFWVSLAGRLVAEPTEPPQVLKGESGPSGFDLQIVGGQLLRSGTNVQATLANIVEALRERYTEANIVLSPGLAKVTVEDLKLRAGRLREELEAVRVASGEQFEVQAPGDTGSRIDPTTGLALAPSGSNAGLFVLREAPRPPQSQRLVEAFNIGPYLEWLSRRPNPEKKATPEQQGIDEIEMMIGQTVTDFRGRNDSADQLKWQYHAGATLLVIIGTPESVEIARKIVNALPGMDSARFGQPGAGRSAQQRAADDAFRARYGLSRSPSPEQLAPAPTDPTKP